MNWKQGEAPGAPEKPAGPDDAGWASLRQAILKAGGQQSKVTAGSTAGADGARAHQFGVSIAPFGNTALVGAHRDDVGVNDDQGSAYVFTRNGTTWTLQAKLIATDGAASALALRSGAGHALGIAPCAANEGLYIDVPPGMTTFDATTADATKVDVYLARVDAAAASRATPTACFAPPRSPLTRAPSFGARLRV